MVNSSILGRSAVLTGGPELCARRWGTRFWGSGAPWAHSAAWAWKCSKMALWRLPGPILRPGLGNAPKWPSGGFLGPFCGLALEMLQNCFLEASWTHSAAWAWKCSTMTFRGLPGPILRPGLGNTGAPLRKGVTQKRKRRGPKKLEVKKAQSASN